MATQRYKCTNFGNCAKADSAEFIDIPDGGNPLCPICSKPLTLVPTGGRRSPIGAIVALLLLGLLAFGAWKLLAGRKAGPGGPGPGAGSATLPAPPPAGTGVDPGATAPPVVNAGDALMYFERSDEKWLRQASEEFNQQNPGSQRIVLDYRGSREGKQDILYGKGQPVLWNPADLYWVDKLNLDWKNPAVGKHTSDAISDSRTILTTRYVLVMWQDRAKVFTAAMQRAEFRGKTWQLLETIATRGWAAVGGPASWGKLKLAQSDPVKSNGGMTTLALMFAEYGKTHPGATPSSAGFLSFMRGIEGAVPAFPETTSKGLEAMLKGGRGQYDMAVSYEVNSIAAVDKGQTDIAVVYPDPTVEVDFPAAVIQAPWVTADRARMAGKFVDYLLTRDVQKRAIDSGFRPALSDMRSDVDNALSSGARASAGFQLDPPTVVRPVGTRVIDDLLYQWYKIYGSGGPPPA